MAFKYLHDASLLLSPWEEDCMGQDLLTVHWCRTLKYLNHSRAFRGVHQQEAEPEVELILEPRDSGMDCGHSK